MPAIISLGKTEKRRDRHGRFFFHTPMIIRRGPLILRDQILTDTAGSNEYRFTLQRARLCRAVLLRQGVLTMHDLIEYMWPDVDNMPDWYERSISVNLYYVRKAMKLFGFNVKNRYGVGVELLHEHLSDRWDTPEGHAALLGAHGRPRPGEVHGDDAGLERAL